MFDEVDFFELVFQHNRLKIEKSNEEKQKAAQSGALSMESLLSKK